MLTTVNNLARCLKALGKPAKSLPLYTRCLEVRERTLGPEHPDTLQSINSTAKCLRALGRVFRGLKGFKGFFRVFLGGFRGV